jgi:S-DNA-T family DNA segregation ATPase FtsK/SpoIIIE
LRGWASQGYSAATIDPTARGVGLLLQEGGVPVRLRSCYLNDLDLAALARRAELLRSTTRPATAATLRLVEDESA